MGVLKDKFLEFCNDQIAGKRMRLRTKENHEYRLKIFDFPQVPLAVECGGVTCLREHFGECHYARPHTVRFTEHAAANGVTTRDACRSAGSASHVGVHPREEFPVGPSHCFLWDEHSCLIA